MKFKFNTLGVTLAKASKPRNKINETIVVKFNQTL